jgi:hypothetical protein
MVDALSGVSAVGPVVSGHAIDSALSVAPQNVPSGVELSQAVANELSGLELSRTGQLIESILGITLPQNEETVKTQALLGSPAVSGDQSTADLAHVLSHALSNSGIFYESHLADWVSGLRSQTQILQEPQAQLDRPTKPRPDVLPSGPTHDLLQNAHTLTASLTRTIHPQSLGVLQQQLQSLDSQVIPWQGQIWPGQDLQWSVQPDDVYPHGDQEHGAGSSPIHWKSTLKLSLPHLGEVLAELRLGPQGCQISLITDALQVSKMKLALPVLGTRLQDAGIRTEQLSVQPKDIESKVV